MKIPISEIKIGRRIRKDLGDIKPLAESMDSVGLIQPIVVSSENRLLAGRRRLAAAKLLKWKTIEARIMEAKK